MHYDIIILSISEIEKTRLFSIQHGFFKHNHYIPGQNNCHLISSYIVKKKWVQSQGVNHLFLYSLILHIKT